MQKATFRYWFTVMGLSLLLWPPPVRADDLDEALERATKAAVQSAAPSIVQLQTVGGKEFIGAGQMTMQRGRGPTTGVIVSADGFLVTSSFNLAHQPSSITVFVPNHKDPYPAKVIAQDQTRMITLLKIDAANLPVPQWVRKNELKLGQWALALGRTWSDSTQAPPSVSIGILSAFDRIWGKAIQTDAKVSPVNYGGPLIDLEGRLIGILCPLSQRGEDEVVGAEWYDSGIGFAIPMEDIFKVLDQLKAGKNLERGILGVQFKPTEALDAIPTISLVYPESTAEKAGLQPGDTIIEVDGQPIARMSQLRHVLGPKYAGEVVALKYKRDKDVFTIPQLPLLAPPKYQQVAWLGIAPVRDDPAWEVTIRYVFPNSPAAKAKLQPGDKITTVEGRPVPGRDGLAMRLGTLLPGSEIKLGIRKKDGKAETLTVKLGTMSSDLPTGELGSGTAKKALTPRRPPPGMPGMPPQPTQPAPTKPATDAKPVQKGFFETVDQTLGRKTWTYVPDDYDPNISYSLLVWMHPAGDTMQKTMRTLWEPLCKQHHIILYAPMADNPSGWITSEADGILQDIRSLVKTYTIDRQRIVTHGLGQGGTMAIFLGLDAPDWISGVASVGGVWVQSPKETPPGQSLFFFLVSGGRDPNIAAIRMVKERVIERKYPLWSTEIPDLGTGYLPTPDLIKQLVLWIETLDRL